MCLNDNFKQRFRTWQYVINLHLEYISIQLSKHWWLNLLWKRTLINDALKCKTWGACQLNKSYTKCIKTLLSIWKVFNLCIWFQRVYISFLYCTLYGIYLALSLKHLDTEPKFEEYTNYKNYLCRINWKCTSPRSEYLLYIKW